MQVGDFQGVRIYRALPEDKRLHKDGSPRHPRKVGKIHYPVFTSDGHRVVGFMVKQPDVAGMIKQEDRFVALDAIGVDGDFLVVRDEKASFDAAAAKRLGIDLDRCLIWTGMDVFTESGTKLGFCVDAACHPRTGAVNSFAITPGATSSALVGDLQMPARLLVGYREGAMIVSDAATQLEFSGGAAAKAAEASVKVGAQVKKGAKVLDEKGSRALDKGSRALGKQLGKTKGMFGAFASEFKKASASPSSGKKKPRPKP